MYVKNGKRIIEVAIKHVIEFPANITDEQVELYLTYIFAKKEFVWCDGDKDVLYEK